MTLGQLADAARAEALDILGTCETTESDGLPQGTLVLLGPDQPDFWSHVWKSPEFTEGGRHPLDRWSQRVVTVLAEVVGGTALFPFGSPAQPFISWALRSGRCWVSPVGLLVHEDAGLWVSFRGAILLADTTWEPVDAKKPCDSCEDKPCLTACPASALSDDGYNLKACHTFLDTQAGEDCMAGGCAVRRICPVSERHRRDPVQSAFHMRAFHPARQT